jgi:hypothetical protein
MMEFLLMFQLVCLIVQLGCLFYCIKKRKCIFDVLYGFGLWGAIPITLALVIRTAL